MTKVQYVGLSNYREITSKDWKSIDVEDQETVLWDRDETNPDKRKNAELAHELSDAAWAWLKANDKDFKEVKGEEPADLPGLQDPNADAGQVDVVTTASPGTTASKRKVTDRPQA